MKQLFKKHWVAVIAILSIAFGIWIALQFPSPGPADDPIMKSLLDTMRNELKQLQLEQEAYQREKKQIRNEITSLRNERLVIDAKLEEYKTELKNIQNEYSKIPNRYRNISADSTRILFNREFDY